MLRLSPDRRRVFDESGELIYEALDVDGRTVYAEPGARTDLARFAETGVKMACLSLDDAGNCREWTTIEACLRWVAERGEVPGAD